MNTVSRGIRNAFRNVIRTFSITVILSLSIALALAMLVARQAVQSKIDTVKSSIGNTISISPAGAQGFQGGGEPLTTEQLATVSQIPNVTNVTQTLNDRLTTENSNLKSAIDAGSLGRRQAGNSGVTFSAPPAGEMPGGGAANGQMNRSFTPPVTVTGVNSTAAATVFGGDSVSFTAGENFDASKDENVALVGKALAEKNNLQVGSTFTAYNATITVKGIYDAGTTFANAGLVMPLQTLQKLSDQAGDVTSATVTVNSIDNMSGVMATLKSQLGQTADITSNQSSAEEAVKPLESVKTISTFSLIGALVAGAVIILLTMVMIVRERRREIGVMKAIGSSNSKTVLQFVSEAVTLTAMAMVAGIIIGAVAASPLTNLLVSNSDNSSQTTQITGPPTGGTPPMTTRMSRAPGGLRGIGSNSIQNINDVQASVGWDVLAYGVGAAMLIAIIGSAIPALLISKVRPAEVMRAE